MGYTVTYFYSLTPRQFSNALDGFRARQQRDMQTSWEQTRFLAWAALAPHHDAKTGPLTVKKVLPFEWDADTAEAPELTETEIQQIREAQTAEWARIDAKLATKIPN